MAGRRQHSVAFLGLVGVVIAGAVIVRLALLGRQSYWIDELFSVNESAGRFRIMLKVGSTEIHTPFYATLLWGWIKIGGTQEAWTRLLSTLLAVIAVGVAYRGLRSVRLGDHIRWALTVATAASGTSIVYSVDTRSYTLLLLGAVGLTVMTLRAALLTLAGDEVPRGTFLAWAGWVTLAATAHLFGAVLALGAVIVLIAVTVGRGPRALPHGAARRALTWVVLAAAGCSVQAAWILRGLSRPEFAAGTDWIEAPRAANVWDLVTTTFSSGTMTTQPGGFAWASPIGVIVVAAFCLFAALYGYLARRRVTTATQEPTPPAGIATATAGPQAAATVEAQAAAILLGLATIVIVLVFSVSQWEHLWTLRNMVIVTPSLLWGVICLAAASAGTAAGRRLVATLTVALLGLSLFPTAIGLAHPYKADFRGLLEYLITVRAEQPDAGYVFLGRDPPWDWKVAGDRSADDPAWDGVYRDAAWYRRAGSYPGTGKKAIARPEGTEVVVYYPGVANRRLEERASKLLSRLGPSTCRRIPMYGVIVIRCH